MRESFVAPDHPDWSDALRAVGHDVYHFPAYARLCARLEGGDARAFVAREGRRTLVVPVILRAVAADLCAGAPLRDATVPYGYPGPIVGSEDDMSDADGRAFLHRALHGLMARLRAERVVSAFFRLHPLMAGPDRVTLRQFGAVMPSGETVAIDLTLPEEALWRQLRTNHRRDVQKARARGWVAEVDERWHGLDAFVDGYRETMTRVGADTYYLFEDGYYAALREALGPHLHLWTVRAQGAVMAGALFTECGGIVQYHLGATFDRFLPGHPLKLLLHAASTWFKARGNRWLHLGGGVGGASDSLMHFKLGFSPCTFAFDTWRLVLDTEAYGELLVRAGHPRTSTVGSTAFFPAYRQRGAIGRCGDARLSMDRGDRCLPDPPCDPTA